MDGSVDYSEVIEELQALLDVGKAPKTLTSVIRELQRGNTRACYWMVNNEWDKISFYENTHPVLVKVPHIRKLFWQMRGLSERMGWEDRVAKWDALLGPYMDQKDQDRKLGTE